MSSVPCKGFSPILPDRLAPGSLGWLDVATESRWDSDLDFVEHPPFLYLTSPALLWPFIFNPYPQQ